MLDEDKKLSMVRAKLDQDHKNMLKVTQKLFGSNFKERSELLLSVADYISEHFRIEEAAMQLYGYPKLAEHKELHQELMSDMMKYYKRIMEAKETDPILRYIYHLVSGHITVFDQGFTDYLTDKTNHKFTIRT